MSVISTYGSWFNQKAINTSLQNQLSTLTEEASSGLYANPAVQLGAQNTVLYQLQNQYAQANAVQTAATAAGSRMNTMQTALTSMNTVIGSATTAALSISPSIGNLTSQYSVASTQASSTMDQMLGLLNTTYDGQYVFSGDDSGTPTMAASSASGPSAAISTALSNAVASNGGAPLTSSTVGTLETALNTMFSDSNGSASQDYTGVFFTANDNGKPVTLSIGSGQTLSYNLKGNSQAFRDVFQGLSMMSLLNAPSSQLDDTAKQQLATDATSLLNQGQSALTNVTAQLGAQQAQLTNITTTQQNAASATQQQISSMDSVDEYTAATQLQALQTQLEASYEITAQIPQLSFVNYMH